MRTIDAVAEILKREGINILPSFPTTAVIEAAAAAGIKPIICRQERVGVGIADGWSRINNGKPAGAFAMQYGPGAENAYAGVTTAFSDAVPLLLLPLGHPLERDRVFPNFSSIRSYEAVTKFAEQINHPARVAATLRRAFTQMRSGRPGPALVEIPVDVGNAEVDPAVVENYRPVKIAKAQANPDEVMAAAKALLAAKRPVIQAGQGVLYAEGTPELVELAELVQIPVYSTLAGKSAFPERHSLALGSAEGAMSEAAYHFLKEADLVFAIGSSLSAHGMAANIPGRKTIIHATADTIDHNKSYYADFPILGDAKLVLRQFIEACRDLLNGKARDGAAVRSEIATTREAWLKQWSPKLSSSDTPINPYRVIADFMQVVEPDTAIVTHDSGSPRYQIMPFYRAGVPRSYIGWGKSHQLGTGLGLIMGAKLARPDKFCVNFMGDAAFGMTGLDFETAVRSGIPILTIVLNNNSMAVETEHMKTSHEIFRTRDLGGNYADMAKAMGGWSERVSDPAQIKDAIQRARKVTDSGRAALLEFVTAQENTVSHLRAF
ncbi:MAG: thiamine pyrophosphate-requiring protein [Betaproteobacteria bacterium]|nr:thiamine pyrophosphate-requiring protein [Betaproteobacteria bacterium]MBI3053413.1 thiamine pyrophosphate-requiring protein [Betaproteobacteria bacterium]